MNLHEFQAKQLFRAHGIPTPEGVVIRSEAQAEQEAGEICAHGCVVKAQVHAGGRGKAGGVKLVSGVDAMREAVNSLLDTRLVTVQSGPEGQPVQQLLIERPVEIARELYLSMLIDRSRERIVVVASAAGGMDIEEVAHTQPEAIHTLYIDPVAGLQPYQCRLLGFRLGLDDNLRALTRLMLGAYRLFTEKDLGLIEINPLVVTGEGELLALDAKINIDDNALYRHADLEALRDPAQEDELEHRAHEHGLNYVRLDGNIGCMVNGAGLAMATMDIIHLYGGEPANFLDVGGGTSSERVAEAFKLILADDKVAAILVNIFGGIVRCDLIAEGIIQAVREIDMQVPVVVRLEGTNMREGKALLEASGLTIITADDLTTAAQKAVAAAGGQG
ncbi:MAG TPA: ADP-forming succinate--CoA ligase subunit beta [Gammaproteobacteria bacterium]|nr:ADP-forming succinate--CoA ligase subunit beta [Gammaproteobacteria bacterium]